MDFGRFSVVGTSVSGVATTLTVPEFNLNLDLGMTTDDSLKCPTVLLTHGHLDHVHGIIRHSYLRDLMGNAQKAQYLCAPHLEPLIHDLFKLWARFQHSRMPEYDVVTVSPGEKVQVGSKMFARPFATPHRVPCQGYVLVEIRDKLRPEFQGLDSKILVDFKRQGKQITDKVEIPLLAYTGDTTAQLFDDPNHPCLNVPVLLTECTFMGEDQDPAFARSRGHIHLADLVERASQFDKVETIVLVHFSQRYTRGFIAGELGKLPDGFKQKVRFLPV